MVERKAKSVLLFVRKSIKSYVHQPKNKYCKQEFTPQIKPSQFFGRTEIKEHGWG